TLVKPRWEAVLQEVNLSQRLMPRDVSTRWNSTYDMLVFALQYRKAVDSLTGDRKLDLRIYEMDDAEWLVAQQLADILKQATLFFSRKSPNLPMVIPAMDRIDEDFAIRSLSSDYHPAIRIALSLGKATLNKYYDKTDHSETYRIAMSASFVS
ncbi:hypothetical protein B0H14DRAFT_2364680, partial [Mycena olivaceomarginata]